MSDLISRSEVNDVIDELEVYTCGRPNTMKVEVSVLQLQRFINKLKNIPTAYSVDKVVEELEELRDMYDDCIKNFAIRRIIDKAIEIVKQGGVSDDVCEWKRDDMLYTVYKICGGCFTSIYQKDFKYCPYCGKKIKVVE